MARHIIDYIEAIAEAEPEDPAVVIRSQQADTIRLNRAQLQDRVNRTANMLTGLGVGAGDWVGCHLYNSIAHIDVMLAAWQIQAVPVNVNFRYVADELEYLFGDADLKVVVTEPETQEVAREAAGRVPTVQHVLVADSTWEERLAGASAERPEVTRTGDEHYVLYTGGTTGMPKGVVWRQEDILFAGFGAGPTEALGIPAVNDTQEAVALVKDRPALLDALRVTVSFLPLMHGAGQWAMCRALMRGGSTVFVREPHFDTAYSLKIFAEEQVNVVWGAGDAHARPIVDEIAKSHGGTLELESLKIWVTGAVMITPEVRTAVEQSLPGTLVFDAMGASETGGQGNSVGYDETGAPKFQMDEGNLVLDDDMKPIPPGTDQIGHLAKAGHIPLGYHKDPDKTAKTFPTVDGVRYAMPGDMAKIDADGIITLLGRGSVSINTGGEKVFPEEVEKALKTHPAVFDAVVVGTPNPRFGKQVTAVIQLREGMDNPGVEGLAEHCRGSLASYKMPRAVVVRSPIVRSPSGKPDYRWATDEALKDLG